MALVLYKQTAKQYHDEVRHDPNHIDDRGIPVLCNAIYKFRDLALVDELLKDGANVNAFTTMSRKRRNTSTIEWLSKWENFSAIHIAVALGEVDIVRLLLANGADPNALTTNGSHPLFIIPGIYYNENETEGEVESNELEILKLLLQHGSDINARNNQAKTLLHIAIDGRKHDVARYLLAKGCDANDIDENGRTALYFINFDLKCAEILLENNADPNIQNCHGRNVCHEIVASVKHDFRCTSHLTLYDIIRLLHDNHLDLNVKDNTGKTVLHLCLDDLYYLEKEGIGTEILTFLLENGADPNIADEFGWTPPFNLFSSLIDVDDVWHIIKLAESMELLVQYGTNFDKRDVIGQPLLHVLVNSYLHCPDVTYLSAIECIPSHTNFNIGDLRKRTALHLVSACGHWELGRFLLEHGADRNALDCDGNSPLHVAIESKEWAFAKRLLISEGDAQRSGLTGWNRWQVGPIRRSQSTIAFKGSSFVVSLKYCSQYMAEGLSTVATKYFDFSSGIPYAGVRINQKRSESISYLDHSPPEVPEELARNISSASLADLCDEKSVGDFHLSGTCGEEKCQVLKQVYRLIEDLVEKCVQMDARFENKLIWTGSTAEGTKMWAPDEFDFMMELTKLQDQCEVESGQHGNWPIITLRNKRSQKLWSDVSDHWEPSVLRPEKIRHHFATLLWVAAQCLDRTNYEHISFNLAQYTTNRVPRKDHFLRQTNVGVMLTVYWLGETYKNLKINVDITPAIPINNTTKITQKYKPRLRQHALINEFDINCCHVIPYISPKRNYTNWRLSFALLELDLVRRRMTMKQVCLYKCLKLFRDMFQTKGVPAMPSYTLKCFCFDLFFGDKWKRLEELNQFNTCVREVLVLLKEHCYPNFDYNVENYFIAHKPQCLFEYDTAWCTIVQEYLSSV